MLLLARLLVVLVGLACAAQLASAAPAAEILHRFGPGPVHPAFPLTLGADGALYGVANGDAQTSQARLYRFVPSTGRIELLGAAESEYGDGEFSAPLTADGAGQLWGSTGGIEPLIYAVATDGTITDAFPPGDEFDFGVPIGRLVPGGDGSMYGIAEEFGSGPGTVFRVDATGTFTKFAALPQTRPALLLATSQGMVGSAVASDGGTDFFHLSSDGTTANFAHATAAAGLPLCLIEGPDQALYGLSSAGGSNGQGALFRLQPGADAEILVNFGSETGVSPSGNLALGDDGKLYGFTAGDGKSIQGTAFRVATDGTFESLGALPGNAGNGPVGAVAAGGAIYGTVAQGGDYGLGAIVRVGLDGAIATVASYLPWGSQPAGRLVEDAQGNLYGATQQSGPDLGNGLVYKITPGGDFVPVALLPAQAGFRPQGGVTLGADGALYGTTSFGGADGQGAAFRAGLDGVVTLLGNFDSTNGANCQSPLTLGPDGNLYGSCYGGGTNGGGTVFELDPAGGITKLADASTAVGDFPQGALVEGPDHALYGATYGGGTHGAGAIFRVTMDGQVTVAASFEPTESSTGGPLGQIAFGEDGALYGLLIYPSQFFRWPRAGAPSILTADDYIYSSQGLALAGGRLYGATGEIDETGDLNIYTLSYPSLHLATQATVTIPNMYGSGGSVLTAASDGHLYGMNFSDPGYVFRVPLPANNPPVATAARFSVVPGKMNLPVLAGDSDADGDALTITSVAGAAQGDVTIETDGTLSYTAHKGFNGSDTITYEVTDGFGGTTTGTVEVYNTTPTAPAAVVYTQPASPSTVFNLAALASDPDAGQKLSVTAVTKAAHGAARVQGGKVVYTPNGSFAGKDQFTYTVSDGFGGTATATVKVLDTPLLAGGVYGGRVDNVDDTIDFDYLLCPMQMTIARTGAFTGVLAGTRVHGSFNGHGQYKGLVAGLGVTYTLRLQLGLDQTVTGTMVDQFGNVTQISGGRQLYYAGNPAPQAGAYTFTMEGGEATPFGASRAYYLGAGFGDMNVSRTGGVRLAGYLADGVPWGAGGQLFGSGSSSLQAAPKYPGYVPGHLAVAFDFANATDSDASGTVQWSRTIEKPFSFVSIDDPGYSVSQSFTASRYVQHIPALPIVEVSDNASIGFFAGPFTNPDDETLTWSRKNTLASDPAAPRISLKVNVRNGLFSGTFQPKGTSAVFDIAGALLQKANRGAGFFSFALGHGGVELVPLLLNGGSPPQ